MSTVVRGWRTLIIDKTTEGPIYDIKLAKNRTDVDLKLYGDPDKVKQTGGFFQYYAKSVHQSHFGL